MTVVAPESYGLSTVVGVVACMLTGAVGLWFLSKWLLEPFTAFQVQVIRLASAGAALLALVAGWLLIASPHFTDLLPGDWMEYHAIIADLSPRLVTGEGPSAFPDRAAFFYLLAAAQALFGTNGFVSVVVNATLAGATVLVLADLARRTVGRRAASATAVTAALFPALALWSGLPLREALVSLLLIVGVDIAIRVATMPPTTTWGALGGLASGFVLLLAMSHTRRELLAIVSLALLTGWAINLWQRPAVRRISRRAGAQLAFAGLVFLVATSVAPDAYRATHTFAERAQNSFYNLHSGANTAIGPRPTLVPTSPIQAVTEAPAAMARALLGPPPGPILVSHPHFLMDVLALWVLTPFTVAGVALAVARRGPLGTVLLLPALLWAAISGLMLGNWGIVSRMRLSSWLLLLPFAGLGLAEVHRRFVSRMSGLAILRHPGNLPQEAGLHDKSWVACWGWRRSSPLSGLGALRDLPDDR